MKKTTLPFFMLSLFVLSIATGCKNDTKSSNSSSSLSKEYPTLAQAIQNTTEYAVTFGGRDDDEWYFEFVLDDYYFYEPANEGYIILQEDPQYFHAVTKTTNTDENGYFYYELNVHGKRGLTAMIENYYYTRLIDIVARYCDDFVQVEENLWSCSVAQLGDELEAYFQAGTFGYANYFEIKISEDGKIEKLMPYEVAQNSEYLLTEIIFKQMELSDYAAYQRWVQKGKPIDLQIYDLKMGYFIGNNYYAVYDDEEVKIQGTVTDIDAENNVYIANSNPLYGSVGLKVQLADKTHLPAINDIIEVQGCIQLDEYSTYLSNASFKQTGNQSTYPPAYDEETLVDSYGGGIYAASFFSLTSYFSDSLYSTFAYIESIPKENIENQDTEIILICPQFVADNDPLRMKLVLPKEMDSQKRDAYLQTLNEYGIYQNAANPEIEISIQNVLLSFDMDFVSHVILNVIETTIITKRMNFVEKVASVTGYNDFPMIETTSYTSYRFGGSTGMFLEQQYGMTSQNTVGVYLFISSVSLENVEKFIADLENENFVLHDEIKDAYSGRHTIYKKQDYIVDMVVSTAMMDYENKSVSLWVYKGELLYKETIFEVVNQEIGDFFPAEDFVKLANSYEADYNHFELLNYAGHDFDKENPLHCFTIDLDYEGLLDLTAAYREKGYSYYRNEDNSLYTYTTRGSNHYVLYKNIENSEEKLFVDIAMYPTTDYTYAGHNLYSYRVEVLIYQKTEPLSTYYEPNLDAFMEEICSISPDAVFQVSLPEDAKIEYLKPSGTYAFVEYGYYLDAELFIYSSDVEAVYQALVQGLENAGYNYAYSGQKSDLYRKVIDPNSYTNSDILLMKDESRGFVRVINGIGGVDF